MYRMTAETLEELTLNAAQPSCHANSFPWSLAHRDELDLIASTAFARESADGI